MDIDQLGRPGLQILIPRLETIRGAAAAESAILEPRILNALRKKGRISLDTFIKVKGELYGWLTDLYYKEVFTKSVHTYDLTDIDRSMEVYFTGAEYRKMKLMAPWLYVRRRWIKYTGMLRKLFRKK